MVATWDEQTGISSADLKVETKAVERAAWMAAPLVEWTDSCSAAKKAALTAVMWVET